MRMEWTEERVAMLKDMLPRLSYFEIAAVFEVSRNAIAGAVDRLKLGGPGHPHSERRGGGSRPRKQPADDIPCDPVPLVQAGENACHFPLWSHRETPPRDFENPARDLPVCGRPKARGSYCWDHARLCYGGG
jgi:hypothetical protein